MQKNIFKIITLLIIIVSNFCFIINVEAAFNKQINYQGKITTSASTPLDGTYNMSFSLYNTETGGTAIWTEDRYIFPDGGVSVTEGLFSILLGELTSLNDVNFNQSLYLGITIESDSEMTPRKILGAVPAAFEADKLDGIDSLSFLRSDQTDTIASSSTDTILTIQQSGGTGDIINLKDATNTLFTVNFEGNVGIGIETPTSLLSVGASEQFKVDDSGNIEAQTLALNTPLPFSSGGLGINTIEKGEILVGGANNTISATSSFLFVDANGNIGINNNSPTSKLTVSNINVGYDPRSHVLIQNENAEEFDYAGIMFSTKPIREGAGASDYADKSYIGVVRTGSYGRNSIVFLQNDVSANTSVTDTDQVMLIASNGNVGIGTNSGTTTPEYGLTIGDSTNPEDVMIAQGALCVDDDDDCSGAAMDDGTIYAVNTTVQGADYAEYYFTNDTNLKPEEIVCIDIEHENAVKRCDRESDANVMGIVSSNPAIVGNNVSGYKDNPHYKIIGMLGQVPAKASNENGSIRPGDSLTSASIAGFAMKANAGDPTVGVALEKLDNETGTINVLISRRNKSLTIEKVEDEITQRIASMEIEDEVNILVDNAIDNLNLDDEIIKIVDEQLLKVDAKLNTKVEIINNNIDETKVEIVNIKGRLDSIELAITQLNQNQESTIINVLNNNSIAKDEGILKLGNNSNNTSIVTLNNSLNLPAFVVSQENENNNIALFKKNNVEVVKIDSGLVNIHGNLGITNGRVVVCSSQNCDKATKNVGSGDIGVEGKIIASNFENYCESGWIWIPGSTKYGTMPGFCVMADKARISQNKHEIINTNNSIWTNISQGEAELVCSALGSGYHLLSENEWMTIAQNIIQNKSNDKNGEVSGIQLKGNSYVLSNGGRINNLANGIGEWTDKIISAYENVHPASNDWKEYYEINNFKGLDIAPPYYYTSTNGIGKILAGNNTNAWRGFVRGQNGIYSLDLSHSPDEKNNNIGFRCGTNKTNLNSVNIGYNSENITLHSPFLSQVEMDKINNVNQNIQNQDNSEKATNQIQENTSQETESQFLNTDNQSDESETSDKQDSSITTLDNNQEQTEISEKAELDNTIIEEEIEANKNLVSEQTEIDEDNTSTEEQIQPIKGDTTQTDVDTEAEQVIIEENNEQAEITSENTQTNQAESLISETQEQTQINKTQDNNVEEETAQEIQKIQDNPTHNTKEQESQEQTQTNAEVSQNQEQATNQDIIQESNNQVQTEEVLNKTTNIQTQEQDNAQNNEETLIEQ